MFRRAFTSSSRSISLLSRLWNGSNGVLAGKHAEQKMISILRNRFPQAQLIEVTDVSGGCGAMFDINVVAPEFKGLNTVKQHRIINEVLKEEIKDMHGLRIRTSIPQTANTIVIECTMAWNIFRRLIGPSSIFQNRLSRNTISVSRITRSLSTVRSNEIEHFSAFKNDWWDENGPLYDLHLYAPIRIQFVRDGLANAGIQMQDPALPLKGIKIVDVGCGGGILTERLARIGAQVTGIDASAELINVAKEHAKLDPGISERVNYIQTTVEDFSQKEGESYDAVVASEVLEHVEEPQLFLKECVKIMKPGGSIFITTPNQTLATWLVLIVAGEYIFRRIPPGTHEWNKFITPHEVQRILDNYGCKTRLMHGMKLNPLTKQWSWSSCTAICYGLHAIKQTKTGNNCN
ncbi:ubiquinone biosynthesis O-methyltransferase-like isoform X3 [Temnothorax nylanderi]|uniref:ubiquinone biosynthesis O-methyltransferase-like isoform X3 n=1 Tax=Temnothorax nylanderi TaxID=102681 RepID=UPI003A86B3C8